MIYTKEHMYEMLSVVCGYNKKKKEKQNRKTKNHTDLIKEEKIR